MTIAETGPSLQRTSGVLLHPTALPVPRGMADLSGALPFLSALVASGSSLWQILPLGPVGAGRSPYDALSAFAGSWELISCAWLQQEGLLPSGATELVRPSFRRARAHKQRQLRASWRHCQDHRSLWADPLAAFVEHPLQRPWLDDWALFAALRHRYGGPWWGWPEPLRRRRPAALHEARRLLGEEVELAIYQQFLFQRQWRAVHERARRLGIRICGDLPIYVAHDSADVWAHPELFELREDGAYGRARQVAGVPPDAFSATGQLWGSPVYRWAAHREQGYRWWIDRLGKALERTDLLRLDHFRGFSAFWSVPAGAEDARAGSWRRGPGVRLFEAARAQLGELPLIAEDLGVITPGVRRLQRRLGLPGMKVLQFAFGDPDSSHLPCHHRVDDVVYTGTHDNDTTRGWFEHLDEPTRARVLDYFEWGGHDEGGSGSGSEIGSRRVARALVGVAFQSVAHLAVVPMQDILELGSSARFNTPATTAGNWRWRMASLRSFEHRVEGLLELNERSGRLPTAGPGVSGGPPGDA